MTTKLSLKDALKSMGTVRIGRVVGGALGILFFGTYLNLALDMPQGSPQNPGPGAFPVLIGYVALAISVLLIFEALLSPTSASGNIEFPRKIILGKVVLFVALSITYIIALPTVGQWVGSVVFLTLVVKILGRLAWWKAGLIGLVAGVSVSAVFIYLLNLRLPTGIIF